jgi:hypothetical protein
MKGIINSISDMLVSEDSKIMKHEIVAMSNVVSVAKERIWIADSMEALDYDTNNFSEEVPVETIKTIKQSIMVIEKFLDKHKQN